jgi:hypothetical protein
LEQQYQLIFEQKPHERLEIEAHSQLHHNVMLEFIQVLLMGIIRQRITASFVSMIPTVMLMLVIMDTRRYRGMALGIKVDAVDISLGAMAGAAFVVDPLVTVSF